jgi:hypothetical protein
VSPSHAWPGSPAIHAGSSLHPTSASWLNAVEGFFSALTRRHLRRSVFRSIADPQAAINRYIDEHNGQPKPFIWTKSADSILDNLKPLYLSSESVH